MPTSDQRPKRQGNYIPAHIKAVEEEIAEKYAKEQSAKSLGREYGISKNTVLSIARRHGIPVRGKEAAGVLCRTRQSQVPIHPDPTVSVAKQVAAHMGLGPTTGLHADKKFRAAYKRECAARNPEVYRRNETLRKVAENRIPAWQCRKELDAFWAEANRLGLQVDHKAPLQSEIISGLNVTTNLQMLPPLENHQKYNKFQCGPDYTMPPYVEMKN